MTSADGVENDAPPTRPRRTPLHGGAEGSWLWVFQRITGALLFGYIVLFALTVAVMRVSPDTFNQVIRIYQNPLVGVLEVVLVGAVLFHALNGLRVMIIDGLPRFASYRWPLTWAMLVIWALTFVPAAVLMLGRTFTAMFGQLP